MAKTNEKKNTVTVPGIMGTIANNTRKASGTGESKAAGMVSNGVQTYASAQNTGTGGAKTQNTSSGYTPVGTYNDANLNPSDQAEVNYWKSEYAAAEARGDEEGMRRAHAGAEAVRGRNGYSGGVDGSSYIYTPNQYVYTEPEEYDNSYDPQIWSIINDILNRDDFSYDYQSDPLYQQYQQQYQREGDRAMNDTLAAVASGAGGMNSYAVTAAHQANNYYMSQLGDKIPELYQLAYDMWLDEKESQIENLGILQSMDARDYARYRDMVGDYREDRNFAYGVYRDDVGDDQWNQTTERNNYESDRDFEYKKEQDADRKEETKREEARDQVWELIDRGMPVSDQLLAEAGYSNDDYKYNGGSNGSYTTVSNDVASMVEKGDKNGAKSYVQEALNAGYITWTECLSIISRYDL